jgi:hypothetical protein
MYNLFMLFVMYVYFCCEIWFNPDWLNTTMYLLTFVVVMLEIQNRCNTKFSLLLYTDLFRSI